MPIKIGDLIIGVVSAESRWKDDVTEADEQLLTSLAGQWAIGIQRLRTEAAEQRVENRAAESRAALNRASEEINRSLDPVQVYAATHRATERLRACDVFVIAVLDPMDQRIEVVYEAGADPGVFFGRGDTQVSRSSLVISLGEPLRIDRLADLAAQPAHFGSAERIQSVLAVPMRLGEKVFGMLSAQAYRPAAFTAEDEQTLSLLANQAAVAVEHARAFAAERDQRHLAEVLRDTGAILGASLELEAVLDQLLEQVACVVPYDTGTIMLIDGRHGRIARLRGYERYGASIAAQVGGITFDID